MSKKWVLALLPIFLIVLVVILSRSSVGEVNLPFSKTDTPTLTSTFTPSPTNTPTSTPAHTPTFTPTFTPTATPAPLLKVPGEGFAFACELALELNPEAVCPIFSAEEVPYEEMNLVFIDEEGELTGEGLYVDPEQNYFCGQEGHVCASDGGALVVLDYGTLPWSPGSWEQLITDRQLSILVGKIALTVMDGTDFENLATYPPALGIRVIVALPLPEGYVWPFFGAFVKATFPEYTPYPPGTATP